MDATGMMILLMVCMAFGMPLCWSFAVSCALYMVVHGIDLSVFIQRLGSGMNSFTILAIPLFMLAGEIMNAGGITRRIVGLANKLVGHLPAGLGHVSIVANFIMAGMSGSAVADASALGTVMIPAMKEQGYRDDYAGAVNAAASTMGPIVPPSIPMVIYGVTVGASITDLFLAGFIPGFLMAVTLMIMNWFAGRSQSITMSPGFSMSALINEAKSGFLPILLPVVIVGGMVSGTFTATEASGVAVLYSLGLSVLYRGFRFKNIIASFRQVAYNSGIVVIIIGFASLLGWIISLEQVPSRLATFMFGITTDKNLMLLIVNVFLLIVGCFMEANAAILILAPVLVPAMKQLGVDPVHFGLIMVLNLMIGLLTPPVGAALYVISEVGKIRVDRLIVAVLPFMLPLVICLIVVTYCPQLVMFLPRLFHQ